jgi:hypothetical protein
LRYITRNNRECAERCGIVHTLALLPPLPLAAEDVCALAAMLFKVAEAERVLPPLPLALPIALRQLSAAEEWELQNESYVSKVEVLCEPVPADDVTGPGAVGMSNVLFDDDDDNVDDDIDDGRKDEESGGAAFGGCENAGGAGFCGEGVAVV